MDEMERRLKKRQRRRMGDGSMDGWKANLVDAIF